MSYILSIEQGSMKGAKQMNRIEKAALEHPAEYDANAIAKLTSEDIEALAVEAADKAERRTRWRQTMTKYSVTKRKDGWHVVDDEGFDVSYVSYETKREAMESARTYQQEQE
jgi:hypothetical protein